MFKRKEKYYTLIDNKEIFVDDFYEKNNFTRESNDFIDLFKFYAKPELRLMFDKAIIYERANSCFIVDRLITKKELSYDLFYNGKKIKNIYDIINNIEIEIIQVKPKFNLLNWFKNKKYDYEYIFTITLTTNNDEFNKIYLIGGGDNMKEAVDEFFSLCYSHLTFINEEINENK